MLWENYAKKWIEQRRYMWAIWRLIFKKFQHKRYKLYEKLSEVERKAIDRNKSN